jgi:hypothetical protein
MPKDGRHLGLGELPSPSVLGLVCFQTHVILDLTNNQVQASWVQHTCQTHITLDLADYKVQVSWTWLTTKSKRLGSDMCAKLTLPCTWLTAKSKRAC